MARRPLLVGSLIFLAILFVFFWAVFLASRQDADGPIIPGGSEEKIGLVRIEGVILDSKETLEELEHFASSPSMRAILIRIDSPGGGVVPSQEIYEEIRKIRDKGKKVVVSMGNVAASGGYYIATASDKIVANPGTLTGSIGVIMELANVEGLLHKIGVESVVIKSGEHKDIASPFRKMTPLENKLMQQVLDDVHDQFIEAVAKGRQLRLSEVRSLSDGRVFTGRQAKAKGLVDELGDLQDAVRITAELIGAHGEPRLVETKKRFSLIEFLRDEFWGKIGATSLPGRSVQLNYLLSF